MKTLKDIDRFDLERLMTYKNKDVHCIKSLKLSNYKVVVSQFRKSTSLILEQGKFYNLGELFFSENEYQMSAHDLQQLYSRAIYDHFYPVIYCDGVRFDYEEFFEHFETVTIADIRKRKIKSILDE